jgi:hypothetical protein
MSPASTDRTGMMTQQVFSIDVILIDASKATKPRLLRFFCNKKSCWYAAITIVFNEYGLHKP